MGWGGEGQSHLREEDAREAVVHRQVAQHARRLLLQPRVARGAARAPQRGAARGAHHRGAAVVVARDPLERRRGGAARQQRHCAAGAGGGAVEHREQPRHHAALLPRTVEQPRRQPRPGRRRLPLRETQLRLGGRRRLRPLLLRHGARTHARTHA